MSEQEPPMNEQPLNREQESERLARENMGVEPAYAADFFQRMEERFKSNRVERGHLDTDIQGEEICSELLDLLVTNPYLSARVLLRLEAMIDGFTVNERNLDGQSELALRIATYINGLPTEKGT